MSMMNANAAATTAMTTNEPLDFVLPEMGDADFSSEELAEDTDGLTMSFTALPRSSAWAISTVTSLLPCASTP